MELYYIHKSGNIFILKRLYLIVLGKKCFVSLWKFSQFNMAISSVCRKKLILYVVSNFGNGEPVAGSVPLDEKYAWCGVFTVSATIY